MPNLVCDCSSFDFNTTFTHTLLNGILSLTTCYFIARADIFIGAPFDNRRPSMLPCMTCNCLCRWLILIEVLEYQGKLRAAAPNVHFLMSLYVSWVYISKRMYTDI